MSYTRLPRFVSKRSIYAALQRFLYSTANEHSVGVAPVRDSGPEWTGAVCGLGAVTGVAWSMRRDACAEVASLNEEEKEAQAAFKWFTKFSFLSLETRRRMFFKYEKRIRTLSTPEKVFEYFSSIDKDGVSYMTAVDLLRALVPVYPPEDSEMERGGALLGEQVPNADHTNFINVFDMDGDNLISFHEYLMVLTLLSIPLKHIQIVFDIVDIDSNGVVDKSEFDIILNHIKKQCRQANLSRGGLRTGLKAGENDQDAGLLVKFFGENGTEKLKLPEFKEFLVGLHRKLLLLEFMHYDYHEKGEIGGRDFARSLCASAALSSISTYLKKVTAMDDVLSNLRITKAEFLAFYAILDQLPAMETALQFIESTEGPPDIESVQRTMKKLTGRHMPLAIMEIVVYLFGDEKGRLKVDDLMAVLKSRCR